VVAKVTRPLESTGPKTNLSRSRFSLLVTIGAIGNRHAPPHHRGINIRTARMAHDKQTLKLIPLGSHAARIIAGNEALQQPLGFLPACPSRPTTLAGLGELGRIDTLQPHPLLADRKAVTIGGVKAARVGNLWDIVQLGGDQPDECEQRKGRHTVTNGSETPRHGFASFKNKPLGKLASNFLIFEP
jgi:hypothetical protein